LRQATPPHPSFFAFCATPRPQLHARYSIFVVRLTLKDMDSPH
jgi:hypothetical protein